MMHPFRKQLGAPASTLVMLIDMQPMFLMFVADTESLLAAQTQILQECALENVPVVVVNTRGYGRTHQRLRQELKRVPRVFNFRKIGPDGFENAGLSALLQDVRAQRVLFMGVYASRCVQWTAASAHRLGYEVFTAADLIENSTHHEANIEYGKSIEWYSTNGVFSDTTFSLAEVMNAPARLPLAS